MIKSKSVKEFYNHFNFRDMVLGNNAGSPPKLLADFFAEDINYIQEKLNRQKYVLEVGCGFGRLLKELSIISEKVVGIDFSNLQLRQAKTELENVKNVELLLMDAIKMTFPDSKFDIAICFNCTMGNMPGIEEQVLREMVRVVKPGGLIIVRVFADTKEVKEAQMKNYKRLGLTDIKDEGIAITTSEGFYSRRFTQNDLLELSSKIGVKGEVIKDCDAGFLLTVIKS